MIGLGALVLRAFPQNTPPSQLVARIPLKTWQIATVGILQAYFFAWVGHFFFEKNRPATFKVSVCSLQRPAQQMTEKAR